MKVRCLLVHVQMCAHHVGRSECFLCPADARLRPLVQPAFIGKTTQGFAVGRKQDIERENLVLADLARQPGMIDAVLDSLTQTRHSVGILDEVIAVEVAQWCTGYTGYSGCGSTIVPTHPVFVILSIIRDITYQMKRFRFASSVRFM